MCLQKMPHKSSIFAACLVILSLPQLFSVPVALNADVPLLNKACAEAGDILLYLATANSAVRLYMFRVWLRYLLCIVRIS